MVLTEQKSPSCAFRSTAAAAAAVGVGVGVAIDGQPFLCRYIHVLQREQRIHWPDSHRECEQCLLHLFLLFRKKDSEFIPVAVIYDPLLPVQCVSMIHDIRPAIEQEQLPSNGSFTIVNRMVWVVVDYWFKARFDAMGILAGRTFSG